MLSFFICFFFLIKNTAWQHGVQAVQHTVATLSTRCCSTNSITAGNNKLLKKKLTPTNNGNIVFLLCEVSFSVFSRKNTLQMVATSSTGPSTTCNTVIQWQYMRHWLKKNCKEWETDILLFFMENYSLPTAAKQNTDPSIIITFIRQCQTLNKKTAPSHNSIDNLCAFLFTLLK